MIKVNEDPFPGSMTPALTLLVTFGMKIVQASEALALAKAGSGFLWDSYNTSLKENQSCWELRFLATVYDSSCCAYYECYILYI